MELSEIKFRIIDFGDYWSLESVTFKDGNIDTHSNTKLCIVKKNDIADPGYQMSSKVSQMFKALKLPVESSIQGAKKDASKKNSVRPQKTSGSGDKK